MEQTGKTQMQTVRIESSIEKSISDAGKEEEEEKESDSRHYR